MFYSDIKLTADGAFEGLSLAPGAAAPSRFSASFPLFLIGRAWYSGVDFEDLADGYGPGFGTLGGDWSGIRDSSQGAIEKMLERALNALFAEVKA